MADAKPIRIYHNVPAFRSTTKQINLSMPGEEEDVHFVSTPTAAHPHRVISMHYNTPDGRPVSEFFQEDGTPEEGVIDPKPQLLPDGPRWSPLDDEPAAEKQGAHILEAMDIAILQILAKRPGVAHSQYDLGKAGDRKTVGKRLQYLRTIGYAAHPEGKKKGNVITGDGIARLQSLAESSP